MFDTRVGGSRLEHDARTGAAALPIVFLVAGLLHAMGVGDLANIVIGGTLHEMGHAGAALLGGRWAFFVPFAFTFVGHDVSIIVVIAMLGGAAWLGRLCVEERCWGGAALCVLVAAAQIRLTFLSSADEWEMWTVFFGCGGELALSALMVMSFFQRLPDRLRWDFWRWPVLVLGGLAFFEAVLYWQKMDPELRATLGGDAVSQSRESDQDMVRLVRDWHWTAAELIRAYRGLGLAGIAGIAAQYAWANLVPSRRG
jgi:hypothetical protein